MNEFITSIFSQCVGFMHILAAITGFSYKEINAIIFLIIQPSLIIFFLILWRLELRKKNL
jgi:hypothetical protein